MPNFHLVASSALPIEHNGGSYPTPTVTVSETLNADSYYWTISVGYWLCVIFIVLLFFYYFFIIFLLFFFLYSKIKYCGGGF